VLNLSVEPGTLNQRWRRVLINTNATNEWDYPEVLNVLKDGSLSRHLRLPHRQAEPGQRQRRYSQRTGRTASTALPTGESAARDTSYNGFDALPTDVYQTPYNIVTIRRSRRSRCTTRPERIYGVVAALDDSGLLLS
jgi:hypothetical protein